MTKISTVEARDNFSDVVNRAAFGKERIVLTRRGKDLVAVVPIEDIRMLEALEDRVDIEAAKEALADYALNGGVSWEEMKEELHRVKKQDV